MTLRKFLRFFKHFGYYMRKDFMWLKNKFKANKKTETEKALARFTKELESIKKTTGSTKAIMRGNVYHVCFNNAPYKLCKIWREGDVMHVLRNNKEKLFTLDPGYEHKHTGLIAIEKAFSVVNTPSNDDEWFAIELESKNNLSIVETEIDGVKTYKIYQKCGVQRPRLEYVLDWTSEKGVYDTHLTVSRGKLNYILKLHYYPMQALVNVCK